MHASFDQLEGRQLFAFTITNAAPAGSYTISPIASSFGDSIVHLTTYKVSKTGTLFISTTAKADKLTLQVKNGRIQGSTTFAISLNSATGDKSVIAPFNSGATKIKRIDISTLGGNDEVTVIADVPVNIRGAAGDDTLNVFAPTRTIEGGSGTNTIREGNEAAGDAYRTNLNSPYALSLVDKPATINYTVRSVGDFTIKSFSPVLIGEPVKRTVRGG